MLILYVKKQQEARSEHIKMLKICWSPGLCPGPRLGSLQRSPRPRIWWGGNELPLPKNRTPAFGPTGPRLRSYGPRLYRPPHFKPWICPCSIRKY